MGCFRIAQIHRMGIELKDEAPRGTAMICRVALLLIIISRATAIDLTQNNLLCSPYFLMCFGLKWKWKKPTPISDFKRISKLIKYL